MVMGFRFCRSSTRRFYAPASRYETEACIEDCLVCPRTMRPSGQLPFSCALTGELAKVSNNAELKQRMMERGRTRWMHATPEELGEQGRQGLAKRGPLVKSSGIKLD